MFVSDSEPAQESFACNGNPPVANDGAEIKNLKNNNRSENRSAHLGGGGEEDNSSPLQEIDEHYVCDIAMMRIGGEESLPVTHNEPVDESPPLAHNESTNNENEVEIDRQEEEQAVSDLVRSSSAGALMEA